MFDRSVGYCKIDKINHEFLISHTNFWRIGYRKLFVFQMKDKSQKKVDFISLQQASSFCDYSQEYLGLRARQGKLRAVKMGRNWVTKKEWLDEYIKKVGGKIGCSGILHFGFKSPLKEQNLEAKRKFNVSAYISLHQAAGQSRYSLEYLSLRARQGKLQAIKLGRNWVTTKEWLAEYMLNNGNGNDVVNKPLTQKIPALANIKEEKIKRESIKSEKVKIDYRKPFNEFWENLSLVFNVKSLASVLPIFFLTMIISSILVFSFQYRNNIKQVSVASLVAFQEKSFLALEHFQKEGNKALETFYSSQKQIDWEMPANLSFNIPKALGDFLHNVRSLPSLISFYVSHDLAFLSHKVKFRISRIELPKVNFQQKSFVGSLSKFQSFIGKNLSVWKYNVSGFLFSLEKEIGEKMIMLADLTKDNITEVQNIWRQKAQDLSANFFQAAKERIWSSLGKSFLSLRQFFQQKILALFNPAQNLAIKEKTVKPIDILPQADKTNQGMIVIPSSDKDEEIKKKIQDSFSDEVKVTPKDESSGIVVPVFKEREGSEYLYIMVPVKE